MATLHTLRNKYLCAKISTLGAEVQSLQDIATGQEYCWQGDPAFWGGRAPILFPIVGGMWDGQCRINQRTYSIPKHGFVRNRNWSIVPAATPPPAELGEESETLTLAVENTPDELEMFPWPYRLEVSYRLCGRRLEAEFLVKNLSTTETMHFQIGGHPSLQMPDWKADGQVVQGYLRFEGRPLDMLRATTQGCTQPQRVPIPWSNDAATSAALARHQSHNALVPICVDTFANEALIFDNHQLSAIEVLDLNGRRLAHFTSSAPVWLVWSPTGQHAPFICVEPWYGLCDSHYFSGSIEDRPFMQHASPGQTWKGGYTMSV